MKLAATRALLAAHVALSVGLASCGHRGDGDGRRAARRHLADPDASPTSHVSAPTRPGAAASGPNAEPSVGIDLLPRLQHGAIDIAGPLVDLGERQSLAFVQRPVPSTNESLNGQSWATVGPRLRLRVPIDTAAPPDLLRVRMRRSQARRIVVVVDNLIVRSAVLPSQMTASVVEVPLPPERFRRDVADVELRFVGLPRVTPATRNAATAPPPVVPAAIAAMSRARATAARATNVAPDRAVVDIDWVHLTRGTTSSAVVGDLVNDVALGGTPRRSLTLYAPTRASYVTVIPPRAVLRWSVGAEGIRGGQRARVPVHAVIDVVADGVAPLRFETDVVPEEPWRAASLDLASLAGKTARIAIYAREGGPTRLAVADPRLESTEAIASRGTTTARHVLMIVLRGARIDRFVPALSPRLASGGLARVGREALVSRALAASMRPVSALASVVTGLPADVHNVAEITDTLDEQIETPAALMQQAGVATAAFSDDAWFWGSGLDRGFIDRRGCVADAAACRIDALMPHVADWLVRQRERRAFALVVTRAGMVPLDPSDEALQLIDPNPYENALSSEQTMNLWNRSRRAAVNLEPRELSRLSALYDASLLALDRGLGALLDRLRDQHRLAETTVLVVGDRGTALGDAGRVGDGPPSLETVSHTILMARIPGIAPGLLPGARSTLDAIETAMDHFGVRRGANDPALAAGAQSLLASSRPDERSSGIVSVVTPRGDVAVRFGELFAIPRGESTLVLVQPEADPDGQTNLAAERPIARAYAQSMMGTYTGRSAADASRTTYAPSTRALAAPVEAHLRAIGWLQAQ